MLNEIISTMENYTTAISKCIKSGIYLGVFIGLVSCGDNDNKEITDETASIRTEETGTFAGTASTIDGNKLYNDFAATDNFESWDRNNDNLLNKDEYTVAFFSTWDANNDNSLNQNEWNSAVNDFGMKDNTAWAWSDWDANKDNKISRSEFNSGFAKADMIATWDKNNDNMLDEKEYSEGLFNTWSNADNDGVLDEEEYKVMFKKYYIKDQNKYMPEMG
jgi:hypothetical protein